MNRQLQNKLKSYSALTSITTLSSFSVDGQIIHTNVNYTGGYETYNIDIDGNGTIDFTLNAFGSNIVNSTYTFNIGSLTISANGGNKMMGIGNSYGSYMNTVYALNSNFIVNSYNYGFISDGILAGKTEILTTSSGFPVTVFELNHGQFGDGATKFVGVEFEIPLTGDTHYGWLRFKDVEQDGSSWTLVDMAYNTLAAESIETGQILSATIQEKAFGIAKTAEGISITAGQEYMGANISLVDVFGREVHQATILSNKTDIANNFASGVYIVRILHKGQVFSSKIIF